jgi:hypothetical protein
MEGLGRSLSHEISYLNQTFLLTAIFPNQPHSDEFMSSVAEVIETITWHQIGAEIGYFTEPDIETLDLPKRVAEVVHSEEASQWASPFQSIAQRFVRNDIPLRLSELVPYDDPSALAVFQSALTAAEQFREPLIDNLTRYLNSTGPVPDLSPINTEHVFMSFEHYEERMRSNFDSSILAAGLLRLIEALQAILTIFPPEIRTAEDNSARKILGTRVVQLLSWRVDLSNNRKIEKLTALVDLFWQACRSEAEKHPRELSFRIEESAENLRSLLNAWNTWSEPNERVTILKQIILNPASSSSQEEAGSSS